MPRIAIDPDAIAAARDVVSEQQAELEQARAYLAEHTELPAGSYGLLLMIAKPLTEMVAAFAMTGFDYGAKLVAARAEGLDEYLAEQAGLQQAQLDAITALEGVLEQLDGVGGEAGGSS